MGEVEVSERKAGDGWEERPYEVGRLKGDSERSGGGGGEDLDSCCCDHPRLGAASEMEASRRGIELAALNRVAIVMPHLDGGMINVREANLVGLELLEEEGDRLAPRVRVWNYTNKPKKRWVLVEGPDESAHAQR